MVINIKDGKSDITLESASSDSGFDLDSMFNDAQDTVSSGDSELQNPTNTLSEEQQRELEQAVIQEQKQRNSVETVSNEINRFTDSNTYAAILNAKKNILANSVSPDLEAILFSLIEDREKLARAVKAGYKIDNVPERIEYVSNLLSGINYKAEKALEKVKSSHMENYKLRGYEIFGISSNTDISDVLTALTAVGNNNFKPEPISMAIQVLKLAKNKIENKINDDKKEEAKSEQKQPEQQTASTQQNNQSATTQQNSISAKQVGIAGAAIAGAAILTKAISGTVYNNVTSIGNFKSGNEMLQSPKLQSKLQQLASKYTEPLPTVEEVKADPRAKSKSSFLGWLLGGSSSASVMKNAGSVNMIVKSVNNVPVSVTSIKPLSFNGSKVLIATAYFKKNNQIVSVPLARGFLNSGNMVNASRECADIYFGNDNKTYTKNDINRYVKQTHAVFGPNENISSSVIDEYCL